MAEEKKLVLVTGGSGFIGAHCIIQCLAAGYRVRTSVRSLSREEDARKMLAIGGVTDFDHLSFVIADLLEDEGWKEAVEGCTYVLHVASPTPRETPKPEDELLIPARDGTLRVLRAANDAGVKRVVVTSAFVAIGYGHTAPVDVFTEELWTNIEGAGKHGYIKSKTIAERAAWEYIETEGGEMELCTVNPTAVFGPVLGSDLPITTGLVRRLLSGGIPACPQLNFGVVDVRDVVDLHLRAMTDPKAKGERFLCVSPPAISILQMSTILRERMGNAAKRCPTREIPNFILRTVAFIDPKVGLIADELGKVKIISNQKAKDLLGWEPRSAADAIVATGESLVRLEMVTV